MVYTNKQAPGVMLYYELHKVFSTLPVEDAGLLIKAIFDYADGGVMPDFSNQIYINMIWDMIRSRIDRDQGAYTETVLKRAFASYKADCKRRGVQAASWEAWRAAQMKGIDLREGNRSQPAPLGGSESMQPGTADKSADDDIPDMPDALEFIEDENPFSF